MPQVWSCLQHMQQSDCNVVLSGDIFVFFLGFWMIPGLMQSDSGDKRSLIEDAVIRCADLTLTLSSSPQLHDQ